MGTEGTKPPTREGGEGFSIKQCRLLLPSTVICSTGSYVYAENHGQQLSLKASGLSACSPGVRLGVAECLFSSARWFGSHVLLEHSVFLWESMSESLWLRYDMSLGGGLCEHFYNLPTSQMGREV